MTAQTSRLAIAPTAEGMLVRIEGRASIPQSEAVEAVVRDLCTGDNHMHLIFDLARCTYVDSTFLGTLVRQHQRLGGERFALVAPGEDAQRQLETTRLITLFTVIPASPSVLGPWQDIALPELDAGAFAQQVRQAHRALAAIPGPQQAAFQAVVDQLG